MTGWLVSYKLEKLWEEGGILILGGHSVFAGGTQENIETSRVLVANF
jgi:hypothetical protein